MTRDQSNQTLVSPRAPSIRAILKKPYARLLIPEGNGQYSAEIIEFPGCVACGESSLEALRELDKVAKSWICAVLACGQSVPEPLHNNNFSGKLILRMPSSLHRKATFCAEREGVSLNQFIVAVLAEAIGSKTP